MIRFWITFLLENTDFFCLGYGWDMAHTLMQRARSLGLDMVASRIPQGKSMVEAEEAFGMQTWISKGNFSTKLRICNPICRNDAVPEKPYLVLMNPIGNCLPAQSKGGRSRRDGRRQKTVS